MTPMLNRLSRMILVTVASLAVPFLATSVGLSATQASDLPSIAEKTDGMEESTGSCPCTGMKIRGSSGWRSRSWTGR